MGCNRHCGMCACVIFLTFRQNIATIVRMDFVKVKKVGKTSAERIKIAMHTSPAPSEVTLGSVAKLFSNAAPLHSHFVHIPMYDCCFRLSDQIVSVCMCNVSLLEVNTQTIFQPVI